MKNIIVLAFVIFLTNCASTPKIDPRVLALKSSLDNLQNNQELASRGGEALKRAINAYQYVSNNFKDLKKDSQDYSLYAAEKLIQLAEYSARAKLAEDKRVDLLSEQQKLVLQARTLEAKQAQEMAQEAQYNAAQAQILREQALSEAKAAQELRDSALKEKQVAEQEHQKAIEAQKEAQALTILAQTEAENARLKALDESAKAAAAIAEAEAVKAEMESLKNQLSDLQAKQTDRGLLITLGDVLFEFNKSELKEGAARNLESLVNALTERVEQLIIVEGHTDSVGSKEYNQELSEKRANSVKDYLVSKGINENRISIAGLGPNHPVANNDTNEGRQRNRRVEIILPNLK
jgi:outer membrane protein OmpA-like peptidoglycan-associated protein